VGQQSAILGDVADPSTERDGIEKGHVVATDHHRATVRHDEGIEAAEQGGLARSALTDQPEPLSRRHVQGERVDRDHGTVATGDIGGDQRRSGIEHRGMYVGRRRRVGRCILGTLQDQG